MFLMLVLQTLATGFRQIRVFQRGARRVHAVHASEREAHGKRVERGSHHPVPRERHGASSDGMSTARGYLLRTRG